MQHQTELSDFLALPFSKTCQEHCQATKEKTSEYSWNRLSTSQNRELLYLDLRTAKEDLTSGNTQDVLSEIAGRLPGELWMDSSSVVRKGGNVYVSLPILTDRKPERFCFLNIGESPIVPIPSKLSWVLEPAVDERFSLSKKAAEGILSRASRRGKELPEILKMALDWIVNRP